MAKPFQSVLNWIYKKFSTNPSGMLITTSVIGWLLSMAAQVIAIAVNPKIKDDQKVFLIPQEFNDALINIGAFLMITQVTNKLTAKMFSTGKLAPKTVREYLNKNQHLYRNKIGKLDFNLDDVLRNADSAVKKSYSTYKAFGTTAATVGAGIFAANIVTPVLRNKVASRVQKSYINDFKNKEQTLNIQKQEAPAPVEPKIQEPEVRQIQTPMPNVVSMKGSMRI